MFLVAGYNVNEEEIKLDLFLPVDVEKSHEDSNGDWYVRGFATTPDLDMQGEIIKADGVDISYFIKTGYINSEHKQEPEYQIGVPTNNCFVDMEKGLYVEAKLFKDNPHAKAFWDLANNIKKSGIPRKLGFSIEGLARKRDMFNENIITEVLIKNVAITKNPANPEATWELFMKSMTTGYETNPEKQTGGEALRHEQLANAITRLTWAQKNKDLPEVKQLWDDTIEHLETIDRLDEDCAIMVLQVNKGISYDEGKAFVDRYNRKESNPSEEA